MIKTHTDSRRRAVCRNNSKILFGLLQQAVGRPAREPAVAAGNNSQKIRRLERQQSKSNLNSLTNILFIFHAKFLKGEIRKMTHELMTH